MPSLDQFNHMPLIAILRGLTPDEAIPVADALVTAGFTCIEVPMNSPRALNSIAHMVDHLGNWVLIGAGTVTRVEEVQQVAERGAKLIVMPHFDLTLIKEAKKLGLTCIPGVATPTEAYTALAEGADALKLFPAEMILPAGVRAFKTVLPEGTTIIPVGGITLDDLEAYAAAGATGFGLGSALYRSGDPVLQVAERATLFVQTARNVGLVS
jgi:2-dehydro-3-deoxyphosphogalactonate aldolase